MMKYHLDILLEEFPASVAGTKRADTLVAQGFIACGHFGCDFADWTSCPTGGSLSHD
jgi:hypothetical protein